MALNSIQKDLTTLLESAEQALSSCRWKSGLRAAFDVAGDGDQIWIGYRGTLRGNGEKQIGPA